MIKVIFESLTKDPILISKEDEAARLLQENLRKDVLLYPEVKGTIYIMTNIRIFGQKRNDLDMIIMGFFDNLVMRNVKSRNANTIEELRVKSFICNIEIKSHPSGKVVHEGMDYFVFYSGVRHNASRQCYEAKFSLRNHLVDQLGVNPYICDVLWFNALSKADLSQMRGGVQDNALYSCFNFKDLIEVILQQAPVSRDAVGDFFLDLFSKGEDEYRNIVKLFTEERKPKGLTKLKFEMISQQDTGVDKLLPGVGKMLTVITGRAGTGKTIQLLQLAFRLAGGEKTNRCLLLTYNHALVSDIQRLIDYTPIPSKVDGRTVSIKTIHSFFHSLMKEFGIKGVERLSPTEPEYEELYERLIQDLYSFVVEECRIEDVETLKDMTETFIDWDYLLIDEGQDFSDIEKKILFKIYGPQRLIVADGFDQFMRSGLRQEWDHGVEKNLLHKPRPMILERRQKVNLVTFVNAFAKLVGLEWSVRPNVNLPGGEIKILPNFRKSTFDALQDNCLRNGCENYDILILEPPTQVSIDMKGNRYFSKADLYRGLAIPLFDGINTQNRTTYPTKDQCRVYQYDSCRGLEGWCVVCADFDELVKYKMKYMADENTLGLDRQKAIERSVYLWLLMPLTRPIDTLVITLTDEDSAIGKILKQLADTYHDFVQWNF